MEHHHKIEITSTLVKLLGIKHRLQELVQVFHPYFSLRSSALGGRLNHTVRKPAELYTVMLHLPY